MATISNTVALGDILMWAYGYASHYDWQNVAYWFKYQGITSRYAFYGRTNSGGKYAAVCIPLGKFSFSGTGKGITITMPESYYPVKQKLRWALCTSDANKTSYQVRDGSAVTDSYQIASGTFEPDVEGREPSYSQTITITASCAVPANTSLYLFLWSGNTTGTAAPHIQQDVTVTVEYSSGLAYISNGTKFEPYQVYIHNGTKWEPYLPYIHDGTEWKIMT